MNDRAHLAWKTANRFLSKSSDLYLYARLGLKDCQIVWQRWVCVQNSDSVGRVGSFRRLVWQEFNQSLQKVCQVWKGFWPLLFLLCSSARRCTLGNSASNSVSQSVDAEWWKCVVVCGRHCLPSKGVRECSSKTLYSWIRTSPTKSTFSSGSPSSQSPCRQRYYLYLISIRQFTWSSATFAIQGI